MGRQDGSIWHGCFNGTAGANIDEYDPLTKMIPGEALGFKPIIDIKVIQREQKQISSTNNSLSLQPELARN